MIDFGLGNVRRGYRRDFPWAIACDVNRQGAMLGGVALPGGETIVWKDDWQSPGSAEELARYAPHMDQLYLQYDSYFRQAIFNGTGSLGYTGVFGGHA